MHLGYDGQLYDCRLRSGLERLLLAHFRQSELLRRSLSIGEVVCPTLHVQVLGTIDHSAYEARVSDHNDILLRSMEQPLSREQGSFE